jgi:hypothetical protein
MKGTFLNLLIIILTYCPRCGICRYYTMLTCFYDLAMDEAMIGVGGRDSSLENQ